MKVLEQSHRRILAATPAVLILLAAVIALAPRALSASPSPAMGIVIPLYTYPTDGTWTQVAQAKNAHPNVPFIAIINPNSGPGPSQDPNYVQGIKNLQAAGVIVLGYVDTAYGGDIISSVEANVNLYNNWYHVNGIMFDEMSNQLGYESYYSTLGNYVHSLGMTMSMGNPGTSVPTSFIGTLDVICVYESNGLPSLSFITYVGYSPANFAVVALGVPLDTGFLTSASSLVSWVYLTDAAGSNPYDVLPTYFSNEIAALSAIDGTTTTTSTTSSTSSTTITSSTVTTSTTSTTTTPSTGGSASVTVNSVDLAGARLDGMWTTWNQGSSVLATGYTPMTFSGTTGLTYVLTVANYNNLVFCQWQDGNTNPDRTITLSGNVVLTASYSTTGSCPSSQPTYTVSIQSAYLNNTSLPGMNTIVTSGGSTVATGQTPLSFVAVSGTQYTVSVSNSGSLVFDHWNTGSTSGSLTIAPSADTTLTAYFKSPVTLAVNSANTAGGSLTRVATSVTTGSSTIATGTTPFSCSVMTGTQYTVTVTAPAGWVFAHWQDGTTNPSKSVTLSQKTTLTAYFTQRTTKVAITVVSETKSGTKFTGMWLTVTSNGKTIASGYTTLTFTATVGVKYTITMSNWRNYIFSNWDNGNTNPARTISPTQSMTLIAYYNT